MLLEGVERGMQTTIRKEDKVDLRISQAWPGEKETGLGGSVVPAD